MHNARFMLAFTYSLLFFIAVAGVSVSSATLPIYYIGMLSVYVVGLIVILMLPYIIPLVKSSWRMDRFCRVYEDRYRVCKHPTQPLLSAMAVLKLLPSMPLAYMDERERQSFLLATSGYYAGADGDAILAFVSTRSEYSGKVVELLTKKLEVSEKLSGLLRKRTGTIREQLLKEERNLIMRSGTLYEGYFILMLIEHGDRLDQVLDKLKKRVEYTKTKMSSIGVVAEEMRGFEFYNIIYTFLYGRYSPTVRA